MSLAIAVLRPGYFESLDSLLAVVSESGGGREKNKTQKEMKYLL